jgi:hypothetical protein
MPFAFYVSVMKGRGHRDCDIDKVNGQCGCCVGGISLYPKCKVNIRDTYLSPRL